jgi:hypothetical protein
VGNGCECGAERGAEELNAESQDVPRLLPACTAWKIRCMGWERWNFAKGHLDASRPALPTALLETSDYTS